MVVPSSNDYDKMIAIAEFFSSKSAIRMLSGNSIICGREGDR